jgi:archaeal preflagellin peptidase FlaK
MDELLYIDIARFIVGFSILIYASYTDIKTRRAPNILWWIMGGIGTILLLIQFFSPQGFGNQSMYLIFIPIMIGMVYLFFQLRLIFGGADAKALMALAILVPFSPLIYSYPLYKSVMPFSWVIFSNAIILFLAIPISLFVYNLTKRQVTFPHCFIGYKISITEAKEKFVWPIEKIIDGKRKLVKMPKTFDIGEELTEFEKLGIKEIWVTPKVPFMIPLFAGFIASFLIGDILFIIMQTIL